MTRKIIGVLGLGVFGRTVARELTQFDQDVIAADNDGRHIEAVADQVSKAAVGDITDYHFLQGLGIDHCDAVVIATGTNLEAAVLAVINCKKLGVKKIVAKAKNMSYEEVLYAVGADLVISPEREAGVNLVSTLLRNKIHDVFHFEGDTAIVEFEIPDKWIGKSIIQLDVRNTYDINIIGLREQKNAPINTTLALNQPLVKGTLLVAIANSRAFEQFDYLDELK